MSEVESNLPSQKDLDAMDVSANAVKIDSVNQLGNIVTNWHFSALNDLHHKAQMPENVGIDIPTGKFDEDGKDVCIDGNEDHRAGFLAGIHYAIDLLETFPIKGVPEEGEG